MNRIKKIIDKSGICVEDIILVIPLLFLVYGNYPRWKYALIPCIVLFYCIVRTRNNISIYNVLLSFLGCNLVIFLLYFSLFFITEGASASTKSGLMCAQTSYTYGDTTVDVAIPLIIKNKTVLVNNNCDYIKYVGYFTKYDYIDLKQIDYDRLKENCIDLGEMAPNSLDFYYEKYDDSFWDALYQNRAHLYVLSDKIIDSTSIVMLNDEYMNVYFMSLEEYEAGAYL